ncbi:MAG TPA: SRPBCC family protein [Pseudonocardiaceae bacterium]|jgi:hypothetical protein
MRTPPAYDGPRPEPATTGYASVTHAITINATPAQVRAFNDDLELEDIVEFENNFPAVADTEPLVGDWIPGSRVGNRRRVRFTDGSYLAEEVLDDSTARFQYLIWGFTGAQRIAIRHGLAEFRYVATESGTRLEWTYAFLPTVGILRPFVRRFLGGVMTPMMTATLAAMRAGAETRSRDGEHPVR